MRLGIPLSRVALAAAIAVLACAAAFGTTGGHPAWAAPQAASAKGPVVFVPLGKFPRSDATKLARYVRAKVGLATRVAGSIAVPRSMFDRTRKQYVAQKLITLLSRPASSQDVVIGLTVEDMYSASEAFRFTFSLRDPNGFAVVSRARMDPKALSLSPDPALRMRRLQKMVLKNVAALALGRPASGNPRSVMFNSILGVDDLDYMTDEVRPEAPSRATGTWLRRSNGVCARGVSRLKALNAGSRVTTPEEAIAYAHEYLDLREQQRSELAAIPGPEDRAAYKALLAKFGKAMKADRAAVAALEARWSDSGVRTWAQVRVRFGFELKASSLELGSRACGRYFDPLTYG